MKKIDLIGKMIYTPKMFGDCSECGHSIIYHQPLLGCLKCDCDEYH